MKELILTLLKTKFDGVDEKLLGKIADKLSKTANDEESAKTAVDGVTFSEVLQSYGDSRADEAQKTAVKNYEAKHKLKDGKPMETKKDPEPKPKEDDETPAWVKELIASNKALNDRISAIEGDKVINGYKKQLDDVLKDAPDKVKATYGSVFERVKSTFKDADDFNAWLEGEKTNISELTVQMKTSGGSITPPKGKGTIDGVDAALKANTDAAVKAQEGAKPTIMGL